MLRRVTLVRTDVSGNLAPLSSGWQESVYKEQHNVQQATDAPSVASYD
jgi:hypothetical protein